MGQQLSLVGALPLWAQLLAGVSLAVAALLAVHLYQLRKNPLRNVPSGKPAHWLMGDFVGLFEHETGGFYAKQTAAHGAVQQFNLGLASHPGLLISDLGAVAFMQREADLFVKPTDYRFVGHMTGAGLIIAEGDVHRRQRKILTPAFAPASIKQLLPIFLDKNAILRDRIAQLIEDQSAKASPTPPKPEDVVPGGRKIEISHLLTELSFDIIGVAGFDYDFDSQQKPNASVEIFRRALAELMKIDFLFVLQLIAPVFDAIPSQKVRNLDAAFNDLMNIGKTLVDRKKKEVIAAEGSVAKNSQIGKDLLSLIVKANMAKDLADHQRMSDEEVMYQVSTLLLTGSETTSTALTWCLYSLACNPKVQDRLREELFTLPAEPTLDELNSLPYLENVLRESLRMDAAVPDTVRTAAVDCVIPLGNPIRGKDGTMMESITVPKGTQIWVPTCTIQNDPRIWGDDAHEFNPDRFDRPNCPSVNVPGVYANLLTFNGGPRNCIGYRFALAGMKATLFTLLRAFTFDTLPSNPKILRRDFIVMLPWIKGEEDAGPQMPLMIKPLAMA